MTQSGSRHQSTFAALAAQFDTIQGRFILSMNDVPKIRDTCVDFTFETVEI